MSAMRRTQAVTIASGELRPDDLLAANRPVILKGFASDWPLVRAGTESPQAVIDLLLTRYNGRPVVGYVGDPVIGGRFFYDEAVAGLNFQAERVALGDFLDRILAEPPGGRSFYVGSTDIEAFLPGLRDTNDLPPVFGAYPPIVSLWIGNRTTAATHYDMSNNLAACMVGRRRFTLFPPEQIANLYPGPLEPTPGGQVVSMVDARAPDFDRYPRFAEALEAGEVAELEPGDVLFFPALWWHQVEALDGLNAQINYWWNAVPDQIDAPTTTLLHGLLSLRDRPEAEKQAWRALFDHYIFGPADLAGAHLPPHARGALAPIDPIAARRLRAQILDRLNR